MYLSISVVSGYISEENGEKCLTINKDSPETSKYDLVFSTLRNLIASAEGRKSQFISFNNGYDKIKFLSDAYLILNELLYFNELIVVIRCVFRQGYIIYPQVYLDNGKYELYK